MGSSCFGQVRRKNGPKSIKNKMSSSEKMIWEIKDKYKLNSPGVFQAMQKVAREKFVPLQYRSMAYQDCALPIGYGQTISQPYTVAFMTHLLITGSPASYKTLRSKVLEVGTGSGYQAAILSYFFAKVYSVEVIAHLARRARGILGRLGYKNVEIKVGDGEVGWGEYAPFDAVLVTAGLEAVPKNLFDQLKTGGVLVAPIGGKMVRITKKKGTGLKDIRNPASLKLRRAWEEFGEFSFVPFVKKTIK